MKEGATEEERRGGGESLDLTSAERTGLWLVAYMTLVTLSVVIMNSPVGLIIVTTVGTIHLSILDHRETHGWGRRE